jgi:hypothetical protein
MEDEKPKDVPEGSDGLGKLLAEPGYRHLVRAYLAEREGQEGALLKAVKELQELRKAAEQERDTSRGGASK